jgi:hypothetical protein
MVPPEVFEASFDRFGPVGVLPSLVIDGGAALLTLLLLGFLIRRRRPWAQQHDHTTHQPGTPELSAQLFVQAYGYRSQLNRLICWESRGCQRCTEGRDGCGLDHTYASEVDLPLLTALPSLVR